MRGDTLRRAAQVGAPGSVTRPHGTYPEARLWTPGRGAADAVRVMVLAPGRSLVFSPDRPTPPRWVATNRLRGVVVPLPAPREAYWLGRPHGNVLRFPGGGEAA